MSATDMVFIFSKILAEVFWIEDVEPSGGPERRTPSGMVLKEVRLRRVVEKDAIAGANFLEEKTRCGCATGRKKNRAENMME
jgi:hypothetical protein